MTRKLRGRPRVRMDGDYIRNLEDSLHKDWKHGIAQDKKSSSENSKQSTGQKHTNR